MQQPQLRGKDVAGEVGYKDVEAVEEGLETGKVMELEEGQTPVSWDILLTKEGIFSSVSQKQQQKPVCSHSRST